MLISKDKLKQIRQDNSWSQEILAKTSGLALRSIQRIESTGKASAESVLAICSVLDIKPYELLSAKNAIEANWTWREIMQGLVILGLFFGTLISLFFMASKPEHYLDGPSLLFTCCFMFFFTALAFGVKGLASSLAGLKYLFVQDFVGGKKATWLSKIYESQIKFCYGGAIILFFISLVAVINLIAKSIPQDNVLYTVTFYVPVVFMPLFYAAILCEGLLRPLKVKLETNELSS
jgi:transcriptional regulator with XRE-family HTH domain